MVPTVILHAAMIRSLHHHMTVHMITSINYYACSVKPIASFPVTQTSEEFYTWPGNEATCMWKLSASNLCVVLQSLRPLYAGVTLALQYTQAGGQGMVSSSTTIVSLDYNSHIEKFWNLLLINPLKLMTD